MEALTDGTGIVDCCDVPDRVADPGLHPTHPESDRLRNRQGDIVTFPEFSVRDLCARPDAMAEVLAAFTGLFHLGRNAVYWAFRGMGYAPGAVAWMPSFHCGVEVDAAVAAGFDVGFYRVGRNLELDLADLEKKLASRPGPVLVIHYFGFPQPQIGPLADLCRDAGVPLVEDCTHALFSRAGTRPLGSFGPLAAFSLSKTLRIYLGGALQVDAEAFHSWTGRSFATPPPTLPAPEIYKLFIKDRVRRLVGGRITDLYRAVRFGGREDPDTIADLDDVDRDVEFSLARPDYRRGMARLSRLSARTASPDGIVERRRANYRYLAARLADTPALQPLFPDLPAGVCPLVFPVWTSQRDHLDRDLRHAGIHPYIFGLWRHPRLAPGTYEDTDLARRHILGLPVQQTLDDDALARLADTVLDLVDRR